MAAVMLTTKDNPFDPRLDYGSWYAWDVAQGYNTCAYLARVSVLTDDFPPEVNERYVEQAVDEIIANNGDLYKKLYIDLLPDKIVSNDSTTNTV
jgi:hypothetical protein